MIVNAHRLRSIGWIALLALCAALVMILAFRVNALRSQVHRAEVRIVALKQEKMYLETEFETRANQQQLKAWNDVEFGYVAPTAGQYLENERQLAAWSKPSELDAPAPIRVASADDSVIAQAAFPAMVSPLSGKIVADEKPAGGPDEAAAPPMDHAAATASLGERLGTVAHVDKVADKAKDKSKSKDKSGDKVAEKSSTAKSAKPKGAKSASKQVKLEKPASTKTKTAVAGKPAKAAASGAKIAANDVKRKDHKSQ